MVGPGLVGAQAVAPDRAAVAGGGGVGARELLVAADRRRGREVDEADVAVRRPVDRVGPDRGAEVDGVVAVEGVHEGVTVGAVLGSWTM